MDKTLSLPIPFDSLPSGGFIWIALSLSPAGLWLGPQLAMPWLWSQLSESQPEGSFVPQRPCAQEARSFLAQGWESCQGLKGEKHEWNVERGTGGMGKGLLSQSRRQSQQEPPVFSLGSSYLQYHLQREKTDQGYVFDVFEEAIPSTKGVCPPFLELKKKKLKISSPNYPSNVETAYNITLFPLQMSWDHHLCILSRMCFVHLLWFAPGFIRLLQPQALRKRHSQRFYGHF